MIIIIIIYYMLNVYKENSFLFVGNIGFLVFVVVENVISD